MQGEKQEPNTDFKPNLVNTVCFLVQFIIQLMTFAVNYQVCFPSHDYSMSCQPTWERRKAVFVGIWCCCTFVRA